MKKAIAIVKLSLLGAIFAVALVSAQAPTAEASFYCESGNNMCQSWEVQDFKRIFIP